VSARGLAAAAGQMRMNDKIWKTKDVAEYLQASESWVRHAAAEGRLPCMKIGGLLRFNPNADQLAAKRSSRLAFSARRGEVLRSRSRGS
jgi:excisionase family DNA binding protein